MLNYGGHITSSFPDGFCSSPATQNCQLCGIKNGSKVNSNNLNQTRITYELIVKIEKCLHCDLNICDQCLNKTPQFDYFKQRKNSNEIDNDYDEDEIYINNDSIKDFKPNVFEQHYKIIKKEFKQNYINIKSGTEKAIELLEIIKIDEVNLNDLNLIKQQVNAKANDLIKQIQIEKKELNETVDSVISEHEKYLIYQ